MAPGGCSFGIFLAQSADLVTRNVVLGCTTGIFAQDSEGVRFVQNTVIGSGFNAPGGPVTVALDGLPSTAHVVAPDGVTHYTTPAGSPLHTVDVGPTASWTPGEVSVMVVQIETTRRRLPRYRTHVLAGIGGALTRGAGGLLSHLQVENERIGQPRRHPCGPRAGRKRAPSPRQGNRRTVRLGPAGLYVVPSCRSRAR